jgi:hypothetical protein
MMQYSRSGLYIPRKIRSKQSSAAAEKSFDFVNLFLFVLLFVVVILFVMT